MPCPCHVNSHLTTGSSRPCVACTTRPGICFAVKVNLLVVFVLPPVVAPHPLIEQLWAFDGDEVGTALIGHSLWADRDVEVFFCRVAGFRSRRPHDTIHQ